MTSFTVEVYLISDIFRSSGTQGIRRKVLRIFSKVNPKAEVQVHVGEFIQWVRSHGVFLTNFDQFLPSIADLQIPPHACVTAALPCPST